MTGTAPRSCPAIYFDGVTSARHNVTIELAPEAVIIRGADCAAIDEWSYPRMKHMSAPEPIFRIGLRGTSSLARLEVTDQDVAHEIDLACPDIDRTGANARASGNIPRRLATTGVVVEFFLDGSAIGRVLLIRFRLVAPVRGHRRLPV